MNLYIAIAPNGKIVFASTNWAEAVPYDANDAYTVVTVPGVLAGVVH